MELVYVINFSSALPIKVSLRIHVICIKFALSV